MIFWTALLNTMYVFWFSLQNLFQKFVILRKIERDVTVNVHRVFKRSALYSSQILIKPEFSRTLFESFSNIKFYENPSNERRVVPCGREDRQTVRHDESITSFWKIFESAWKTHTHIKLHASIYSNGPPSDLPLGTITFRVTICRKWTCGRYEDISWHRSELIVCCM